MDLSRSLGSVLRVNIRRGFAVVLAGAAFLGCTQTLDPATLADSIKSNLESKGVTVKSVTCPSGRPMKKDDAFTCQGVSGKGDAFTVQVTQTDDTGNVNVELDGKVFDPAAFVEEALRHFTNSRKVDCGKERFIAVKGTEMACAVEGGKSATLVFGEGGKLLDGEVDKIVGGQ